jgi:Holliday junction resolvase RusA-like endonuclease
VDYFFQKIGLKERAPHTIRPDADNLKKALMDALTEIQIWRDDAQVYGIKAEKYWTPGKSGAQIWIEEEE